MLLVSKIICGNKRLLNSFFYPTLASFILLSLTGSLLIILGGSIQFGKALWVASEGIKLLIL